MVVPHTLLLCFLLIIFFKECKCHSKLQVQKPWGRNQSYLLIGFVRFRILLFHHKAFSLALGQRGGGQHYVHEDDSLRGGAEG